ncbi:MAG: hypothetical protein CM1200mP10_16740 [Candidatus Neomarinimicrobiota bacterium]|nr:MAG: hypothetical protein CM1200mP10_16740 [Candidatus Neomarinimicrobiota bacterium]
MDSFDFSIAEIWEVDDALHAGPVLMHEGKIRVTSDEEVFFGSTIPNIHPERPQDTVIVANWFY